MGFSWMLFPLLFWWEEFCVLGNRRRCLSVTWNTIRIHRMFCMVACKLRDSACQYKTERGRCFQYLRNEYRAYWVLCMILARDTIHGQQEASPSREYWLTCLLGWALDRVFHQPLLYVTRRNIRHTKNAHIVCDTYVDQPMISWDRVKRTRYTPSFNIVANKEGTSRNLRPSRRPVL